MAVVEEQTHQCGYVLQHYNSYTVQHDGAQSLSEATAGIGGSAQ